MSGSVVWKYPKSDYGDSKQIANGAPLEEERKLRLTIAKRFQQQLTGGFCPRQSQCQGVLGSRRDGCVMSGRARHVHTARCASPSKAVIKERAMTTATAPAAD
jgi:hypothetical protein